MDLPQGFFILVVLIYLFFILQYFFTQLFYSKYNLVLLFILVLVITGVVYFISTKEERIENVLESLGFLYYALLVYGIKLFYKKINSFLVNHNRIDQKFSGKGFTYVSYHKGIFLKGHSWNMELAGRPSWLDHTLSWLLNILPFLFTLISIIIYRNAG